MPLPPQLSAETTGVSKLLKKGSSKLIMKVKNNIVIDDLFNLDNVLGRIMDRSVSGSDEDTDYVAYLLNSVQVITNLSVSYETRFCVTCNYPTIFRGEYGQHPVNWTAWHETQDFQHFQELSPHFLGRMLPIITACKNHTSRHWYTSRESKINISHFLPFHFSGV